MEDKRKVFYHVISDFTGHPLERLKDNVSIVEGIGSGLGVAGEDGDELIEALLKEFDVDWTGFDPDFYFGPELVLPSPQQIWYVISGGLFRDWRSGQLKANREKRRKFTVGHLWQVCERGKWFDPE